MVWFGTKGLLIIVSALSLRYKDRLRDKESLTKYLSQLLLTSYLILVCHNAKNGLLLILFLHGIIIINLELQKVQVHPRCIFLIKGKD